MNKEDLNFYVINGELVHKHTRDPFDLQDIITQSYFTYATGDAINPDSFFLRFPSKPQNRIIALPAYLGGKFNVSGIKWIASFPDNIQMSIPRASAVLILNDAETGYPFACIESSVISAKRTSAFGVFAAETLNNGKRAKTLGIVGCGLIARHFLEQFAGLGWSIEAVMLHDKSSEEAARFCNTQSNLFRISISDSVEKLCKESDIILFATTASSPYINSPGFFSHNPIILHISLRDLSEEIIYTSNNITDDTNHVLKAATSLDLTQKKYNSTAFICGTLFDLISGKTTIDKNKPVIFSPFGLGVLDLGLGKYVHDAVIENQEVKPIDNFFFDLTR